MEFAIFKEEEEERVSYSSKKNRYFCELLLHRRKIFHVKHQILLKNQVKFKKNDFKSHVVRISGIST